MRTFGLMLGVLALSTTATAIADSKESGFYVGAGAGSSDFDVNRDEVLAATLAVGPIGVTSFPATTLPPFVRRLPPQMPGPFDTPFINRLFDHTDDTVSFMLGYTFNRYFSIEASYTDVGEVTSQQIANLPLASTDFTSTLIADQKVEIESVSLTALASVPVFGRFKIFARGGYTHSKADSDLRIALLQAPLSLSLDPSQRLLRVTAQGRTTDDFDSDAVVLGAGVSVDLFKRLTLRADFTTVMDVGGGAFTDDVDVDTLGLTALYRF